MISATYDKDTQLLEVWEKDVESIAKEVSPNLDVHFSEKDDFPIGFTLFKAKKSLGRLIAVSYKYRLVGLLKMIQVEEGLTQQELADKSGISFRTVSRMMSGESNITYENLQKLVEAFPDYDLTILLKPYIESRIA